MNAEVTMAQMRYAIAKFMGYEKVTIGYSGSEEETEWQQNHEEWMIKVGIQLVGDYIVDVPNNVWYSWEDVKYHTSWDWIVPVCRKIEQLGYIVEVTFCVAGMCKIWNQNGLKGNGEHNEPISAVLQAVYQFITWYNQQKQNNAESKI